MAPITKIVISLSIFPSKFDGNNHASTKTGIEEESLFY